ncbi:hypothetical protein [Desulfobacula phenolica]|uniref:Uncharacterized protein n=1 Tax=Desulfobacula phenolica TaxID=90732 RepID=A0A1H2DN69_9BACT|nr:hypothetical protein [Desulfobacula phenolica]SDT84174.1 hypothetical protein SAMN04487931_101149 [Desulfobacula phenolica]
MSVDSVKREILPHLKDFKAFWKNSGPFKYALTSKDFPPILLEPEEWIFSNDITALLKALMQFDKRKMKIVKAPFNPENKNILRPDRLSSWKINNFPEEWNACVCDVFVPEGHLTQVVLDTIEKDADKIQIKDVEQAFFDCLEICIDQLGYLCLKPQGSSKHAVLKSCLAEWEEDEQDAGLL